MKKVLLVVLVLVLGINSMSGQRWESSSNNDDFSGKFRAASVVGSGTEFPYNDPMIVINKFDARDGINFYLNGSGYWTSGTNVSIFWKFNNDDDIYISYSFSHSNDGSTVFFDEFKNNKKEYIETIVKEYSEF